ncbi:transporter substrate-binding domain-containing protein [Streptomyces typhae]|nr:transporter substrate-binding domain-containing protein [Streptomyces typhae]
MAPRRLDPHNSPREAIAWALARLQEASRKSLSAIAAETNYNMSTVSRVTAIQATVSAEAVKAYVRSCGQPPDEWVKLYKLAKSVESAEDAERFAVSLHALCTTALLPEHTQRLSDTHALAASWTTTDTRQSQDSAQPQDTGQPQQEPNPRHNTGQPRRERPAASTPAPEPQAEPEPQPQAGAKPAPGAGAGPAGAGAALDTPAPTSGTSVPGETKGPSSGTGEAPSTSTRKRNDGAPPAARGVPQRRRPRRRTVVTGGVISLALIAGITIWATQYEASSDDSRSSATQSSGPNTADVPEDPSLKRLREARAEKDKPWRVGVKANQPGLSQEKGGEWVGADIEYARTITKALGITGEPEFIAMGTNEREKKLNKGTVDMFVGTYGISPEREKGDGKDRPAVRFAGPYFTTPQRMIVERFPGTDYARINGVRETVNSDIDLPDKTSVCVVKGSTGEKYWNENYPEKPPEETLSDYKACVDRLSGEIDAVLSDSVILREYEKTKPDKLKVSLYSFGDDEEYGIGLAKASAGLHREVCKAMKNTLEAREKIFSPLAKDGERLPEAKEMSRCQPQP